MSNVSSDIRQSLAQIIHSRHPDWNADESSQLRLGEQQSSCPAWGDTESQSNICHNEKLLLLMMGYEQKKFKLSCYSPVIFLCRFVVRLSQYNNIFEW